MNQILVTGNINKPNNKKETNLKNNSNLLNDNDTNLNSSIESFENNFTSNNTMPVEDNVTTFSNTMPLENDSTTFGNTTPINNNYAIDNYYDQNNNYNINDNTSYQYNGMQKEKVSVSSIVRIFAITIIIFGVLLLGNGVYAISKNSKAVASQNVPEVIVTRKGNVLELSIKSDIPLRSIGYAWNNNEMHYVSAKESSEFEISINVIDGEDNKLNISIVDMSNNKTSYKEKYSKAPDTVKPEIIISNEDPKIKITVTDDTALDHVVYKYGDNDEKIMYANADDPTILEIYIDEVETTQATLIVQAVDTSQNASEVSQEVKGTTKPVIKIKPVSEDDPSILQISITCEDNLQKIVIYLGDKRYSTPDNISIDKKQFVQKVKVESGTTIKVNAYNVSEQMAEESLTYTY